jgi:Na+-transporting NADH:ubiquinone oxidoreductase subunit A
MHIKISKGLDIPIKGKPEGTVKSMNPGGQSSPLTTAPQIALNLIGYEDLQLRLLVKPGEQVKIGQPLIEDKAAPGRFFVSPAAGTVREVRRGLKRVLKDIIIDLAQQENDHEHPPININSASREALIQRLMEGGCFATIRSRPFNLLADPQKQPRSIFVKALESAPFIPPSELQVEGYEKEFQEGLNALAKLTEGEVHLIYHVDSGCVAFKEAAHVQKHTAEGPHPISNASLHIQKIDPIQSVHDNIWTLNVWDVISIGYLLSKGRSFNQRVISIAGPGILSDRIGYFKSRIGFPVASLIAGRIGKEAVRFVSGDPLMGEKIEMEDFLGYSHFAFCAIPEYIEREFLHFMGLGINRYTFSKAYLSGHFENSNREYNFTTSLHGEHRPFIDSTLYDKVMPLNVPTMLLVKAVMAEDFELAEILGLLEVDSEDFALPTFVCPSKMEMTDIIKTGIRQYAKEVLV